MLKRTLSACEWGLVLGLTLAAESWLLHAVLHDTISPLPATALHLTTVAVFSAWAVKRAPERRRNLVAICALSIALLGPLGVLGAMISRFVTALAGPGSASFDKWYAEEVMAPLEQAAGADSRQLLQRAEKRASPRQIRSFREIMAHGPYRSRERVLTYVGAHFRPEYAAIVRDALASADPSVRVHAAAVIEKLDSNFMRRLMELDERVKRAPGDKHAAAARALHLDEYANAGLWSPERNKELRTAAAARLQEAFAMWKTHPELRKALLRVQIRLNQHDRVLAHCASLPVEQLSRTELTWYAEALFATEEYARLRQVGDTLRSRDTAPANMLAPWADKNKERAA